MSRFGIFALLALLLVVAFADKPESSSTNAPNASTIPDQSSAPLDNNYNKTKEGLGEGRREHRRNHDDYGKKKHRGGHRKNHDDYDAFPYAKPYFDTHYCSVHGSFRLAYNEKSEKKEYGNDNGYKQQEGSYGNNAGSYGNNGGSYGNNNGGSYGNNAGSYVERKDKPHYVRKITRQYCRYAAAWSEKACRFCCKVVARSAYTNPDDIIAAIFSFDPSDPSSGGAGIESYGKHHDSNEYDSDESYEGRKEGGYEKQQSYGNQGGYDNQQSYGNQGNYNQGGGNNYNGGQSYGQQNYSPPQYGSGPYRSKRNSGYGQSPAPTYGAPPPAPAYDQYQQPSNQYQAPAEQYQAPSEQYQAPSDQYSATPDAYSTKPDTGNKYENNPNAINQCVCCAPKHRYY